LRWIVGELDGALEKVDGEFRGYFSGDKNSESLIDSCCVAQQQEELLHVFQAQVAVLQ